MGLLGIKQVGKSGKMGIWHLTESLEELLNIKQFSMDDLAFLKSFSHEHRKKEWISSRILLERITGDKCLKLIYDEYNKPFLKGGGFHVSISHSHDLITVIVDERETGIDIEIVKPNVRRIKDRFMNKDEIRALEKAHKEEELTLYWCVKESLYKLYGKKNLAFKSIHVEPFEYLGQGKLRALFLQGAPGKKYVLHYERLEVDGKVYMLAHLVYED